MLSAAKEETFSAFGPWCAETCISASKCEGEKPHQGVASKNPALHQGITWSNSTTALGLRGARLETRVRSRCTGKERDSESGLDNFGKRYHASSLGRFMTPDPIMIMKQKLRDPQQWNMYSYTRNNPVTFTDPTGAYTCQGNKDQCAQIKAGYDAAQKALAAAKPKSEQAKQLKSVLDFVGAPGKANGVAVTFGKLDTGTPAQTSTETTRDLLGTSHTTTTITFDLQQLNPDVRLTSGHPLEPLGNDTGAVLTHEGTHGRDDVAQGHDPQSRGEALTTERNAYRNEGYVYDLLGVPSYVNPQLTAPGANRDQTIEKLANASADASGW